MQNARRSMLCFLSGSLIAVLAALLFAGCNSAQHSDSPAANPAPRIADAPAPAVAPAPAPAPAPPAPAATVAEAATNAPASPALPPVRIKAGLFSAFTDSDGNVWLPDQGFADGDTADRPDDLQIANTKDPVFYRTERYGMTAFSYPVPNGKYIVKLHFAETYDGITGPGGRVFSFNVGGQEFKDFDIWVKAGGALRAYIETINVEVTNGKLEVAFTAKEENPEINGIEILPAP